MARGGRCVRVTDCDAVILGAGPAGTSAAILCAQRGLKVVLLEQAQFPRERPGETLQPGIEALLQQLGVADAVNQAGFVRHPGHWVQWAGEARFSQFGQDATGPWLGYQIPRDVLDALLLRQALSIGVQVIQPCRALKLLRESRRVCGVQTDQGAFTAPYVIDASGASSWLSRQMGLAWRRFSPLLIAHYGYCSGVCFDGTLPCGIQADRFGWYWTAKIQADRYHWTRLCFDPTNKVQAVAPVAFNPLTATGPAKGADVSWRLCQQAAGDGYFIAGDAAFVLDPSSSHGVLKALMSGMMAAHCVTEALGTPWQQQSIQQQYQHWVTDWFNRDRLKMHELYQAHPFPPSWLGQI